MKKTYKTAVDTDIELKAEIVTVGEKFIRNNRKYLTINESENIIIGRNTNALKGNGNGGRLYKGSCTCKKDNIIKLKI